MTELRAPRSAGLKPSAFCTLSRLFSARAPSKFFFFTALLLVWSENEFLRTGGEDVTDLPLSLLLFCFEDDELELDDAALPSFCHSPLGVSVSPHAPPDAAGITRDTLNVMYLTSPPRFFRFHCVTRSRSSFTGAPPTSKITSSLLNPSPHSF